jgi:hypothetical protein
MSISFEITKRPIFRTFTKDESSAIYNIEIDENLVEIIFHSNTEKAYVYEGTNAAIFKLSEMIKSPDLLGESLGKVRANLCKSGDLKQIEFVED